MHATWQMWRKTHKVQLMREVERQMMVEGDYASYYYHPTAARYARIHEQDKRESEAALGKF